MTSCQPDGHSGHGATIDQVRRNELVTWLAFRGRRRRVYRTLVGLAGAKPRDRVLDIGCGGGYLARLLATAVGPQGAVTGIDPSEAAVAYTRRRAPANLTAQVGVAQDLDLPDASIDVITSTLAVHHVPADAREAAFAEMFRVTRPSGRLMIADLRPQRPHLFAPGARHHDLADVEDLAGNAGYRIDDTGELPLLRWTTAIRPDGEAVQRP